MPQGPRSNPIQVNYPLIRTFSSDITSYRQFEMKIRANTVFFIYLLIEILFIPGNVFGQNLVSNGEFEDTIRCPSNISQIELADGWLDVSPRDSFGNSTASPDYFNACSTWNPWYLKVGVPSNFAGYQNAHGDMVMLVFIHI